MALRLIEFHPPDDFDLPDDVSDDYGVIERWQLMRSDDATMERVLVESDRAEGFIEWLNDTYGLSEDRRALLLPVEAAVPRVEKEEGSDNNEKSVGRISRDELYQDAKESTELSVVFYALVTLSTIVAAGGMLRDNTAVVIGAMVIAPLIGPNMGLALGTTLGDLDLLKRAAVSNVSGLLLGFALAVGAGLVLTVDPAVPELAIRSEVVMSDLLLALAAGVAGALSFTRGISSALIGVMVAVALLPPLVALGLFIGAAQWDVAYGAFLLLFTNVVSVNLAAVCTFLLQGVRPMRWYEAERAKKATRLAIALWIFAFALLTLAIWLAGEGPGLEWLPF